MKKPKVKRQRWIPASAVCEVLVQAPVAILAAPADAARMFRGTYDPLDQREIFKVALLDVRLKVKRIEIISIGCLTSSLVHPREVFLAAIKEQAAAIFLCHNHPSGDPEPSAEDINLTRRLVQGGALLGIEVIDHVILGKDRFVSLKDRGVL